MDTAEVQLEPQCFTAKPSVGYFTKENASALARKGNEVKWANKEKLKQDKAKALLAQTLADAIATHAATQAMPIAEQGVVREQIARLDRAFLDPKTKTEMLPKLADAKAKLWSLIHPRPGVLKPQRSTRSRPSEVAPVPIPEATQSPQTTDTTGSG